MLGIWDDVFGICEFVFGIWGVYLVFVLGSL